MLDYISVEVGALGTNCYVVYDKETLDGIVVDPGGETEEIQEAIEEYDLNIIATVNTHGHSDHIWGNGELGYPVWIHKFDEECLNDPMKNLSIIGGINVSSPPADRLLIEGDI